MSGDLQLGHTYEGLAIVYLLLLYNYTYAASHSLILPEHSYHSYHLSILKIVQPKKWLKLDQTQPIVTDHWLQLLNFVAGLVASCITSEKKIKNHKKLVAIGRNEFLTAIFYLVFKGRF